MFGKFLRFFDSDNDIGWLWANILKYDEIVDTNIFSTWDLPNQYLFGEDNETRRIGHIINFDASLIEPSYLQIPN